MRGGALRRRGDAAKGRCGEGAMRRRGDAARGAAARCRGAKDDREAGTASAAAGPPELQPFRPAARHASRSLIRAPVWSTAPE